MKRTHLDYLPTFQSISLRFALFAVVALTTVAAQAVPIPYGNRSGTTVDYIGIQEESASDPGSGFFGSPSISGDSLDFNPQAFAASSAGLDSDLTDSNLQFLVMAKPMQGLTSIFFAEAGDTTLTGLAGEAQTTVSTSIFVEITEVNDGGILKPVSVNVPGIAMVFAPKDDFKLSVDGAGTQIWTGGSLIDFGPALVANGVKGIATKAFISLDNTLTAASVAGTSAFIQKKDADALVITVETMEIPEPSSIALSLLALTGCLTCRRR